MAAADISKSPVHFLESIVGSAHRSPLTQPPAVVTGSRGANAALADLLVELEDMGLIDDQTTA